MDYLTFKNISKKYKNNSLPVLNNFDLSINKGEFIVILGPSGSGKSTLLQIICGFEEATTGEIYIDGKNISKTLPKDRDISMVFQNYALFPHMNVYENIEFGMKVRGISKTDREAKVNWVAKLLSLTNHLYKKPKELSGGQRQRVALSRAIVREPKLFLMDEPLSNLDSKLRYSTASEILNITKSLNGTTLYVTHDQFEAMTMADRLVILNEGKIQQVGTPIEIYSKPANVFVATFIGKPEINLINIDVNGNNFILFGDTEFGICTQSLVLEGIEEVEPLSSNSEMLNGKYTLALRPEDIHINTDTPMFYGEIVKKDYLGSEIILTIKYNDIILSMKTNKIDNYYIKDLIPIALDFSKASLFDSNSNRIECNLNLHL